MSQHMSFLDKIGLDKIGDRVGGFLDEVFLPDEVAQSLQNASRAMDRGEFDAALRILYRTHTEQPSFHRTHHLIGLCYFHKSEFEKAFSAFERAIAEREEAVSHLYAGLSAERLGENTQKARYYHQAQVHFRRGLEVVGGGELEFELFFGLGRVYLGQGRADKAVRELKKAVKRRPEQAEARLMLTRALVGRGKLDEAREALDQPAARNAGAGASVLRGELEEASGHLKAALAAYEHALDAANALAPALDEDRAAGDSGAGEQGGAGEDADLSDAIEIEKALIGAARTSLALGDPARANEFLLRVLGRAERADMGEVHALLGEANEVVRNHERALQYYQSALESGGAAGGVSVSARLGIGRILLQNPTLRQGEESARAHFQAVLDTNHLEPAQRRGAQVGLARACLKAHDFSGARRLVDEVNRSDETPEADALYLLGEIALASGDAPEGVMALEEALRAAHTRRDTPRARSGAPQPSKIEAELRRALKEMSFSWQLPDSITDPTTLLEVLRQVQAFVARDSRTAGFAASVQGLVAELDDPLSIALVGEFNAGKSTILNALIGEEVVPMGVLPTTAHTCFVQYGPRRAARIVQADGAVREVNLDEAKRQMKTNAEGIDHLEILYPHPDLRSVEFWDTPGFNALDEAHEETASEALKRAEAILWVLDANQALSKSEFDQIESIVDGDERLVVLLNKIDRLGPAEARDAAVQELVDYVETNASGRIAGCFALAGKDALALRMPASPDGAAVDDAQLGATGFTGFRAFLDSRIIERSGRIKTLEISRKLAALLAEIEAFQRDLVVSYASLARESAEIEAWQRELSQKHPDERALGEARALEDRFDFMISGLEREINEALRSQRSLLARASLTKKSLADEDRDFILELLSERIADILERSRQQVLADVEGLESRLAQKLGTVIARLPLADARAMNRRMEGFFGEIRVLKLLLGERVYGRMRARATGQIEAAGRAALDSVRGGPDGAAGARSALRRLLPDVREHLSEELRDWYAEFFLATGRFLDRVQRDLYLLKLEAEHRFDVSVPGELIHSKTEFR